MFRIEIHTPPNRRLKLNSLLSKNFNSFRVTAVKKQVEKETKDMLNGKNWLDLDRPQVEKVNFYLIASVKRRGPVHVYPGLFLQYLPRHET